MRLKKIIVFVVVIVLILAAFLVKGVSRVKTDKLAYKAGEEVKISYLDLRLIRSNQGPIIKLYRESSGVWEKIEDFPSILTFGQPYCLDGQYTEGGFPADVVSYNLKPYKAGSFVWTQRTYEKNIQDEVCMVSSLENVSSPKMLASYKSVSATVGNYKVTYGGSKTIFRID